MSQIKERPILFSAPMVRAILEDWKTVTRRAVKVQPHIDVSGNFCVGSSNYGQDGYGKPVTKHFVKGCCPYGKPGNRLWVRESLGYDCEYGHYFAAGGRHGETVYLCSLFDNEEEQTGPSYDGLLPERSVPSIHLHRRYSRILLEITDVRVERLQDISEQQAITEGCEALDGFKWHTFEEAAAGVPMHDHTARDAFEALWESINGEESWPANPWVWVVEFKRVKP